MLSMGYAFAQETTSQIEGTVVTDSKAGLAGATVVALHTPTGTKYTTTTRKDGRFNLAGLRVGGPYTLTITYVGFKEEKQENINLVLGQDFTSDFTMIQEAKELQATVVSAARQNKIFNNAHTGEQEIITRAQMEQLPTVSRALTDFTKLEPTANGLSFGGTYSGFNNVTVDGADFNNSFGLSSTLGGQTSAQPIALDAVDQIQVNVSPYDVRQGGFTGAGINSVTRGGTNQFKGSIYTYLKGPNTIGYKADDYDAAKTPFTYNVTGASLGGPIITNKLFFFVSAEQDIQTAPATGIIPSDATHSPVPNVVSQASVDTLNMISSYLKSQYNYNPGAYEGYSFKTNNYKVNARLDYNINTANVLTLKYNYLKSYQDEFASTSRPTGYIGNGGQPGTYAMPFQGSGYRINNNLDVYIAELNSRFGNSASNKLQVGYTRERDFRTPQSSSTTFPLVDILSASSSANIMTTFGYEPYTYNNTLNMDSYQLSDIFTFYKGAHEITIGSQNSYKKYQNAFAPVWNGDYQFNSAEDFLTGKNAATYLQEYSTLPGAAFPWAYAGATNLSLFVQDKYRATNNFTLTYGIRADYTNYQNKFTDNTNFDQLSFLDGRKYDVGSAPNGFFVVSPRVGFNWDITGDKTWQLRGGAGIFEGAPPFVWIENQAANNGVQLGSIASKNVPFFSTGQAGLNNYLTSNNISQTTTPISYGVDVTDKHLKYPTKLRSSIALDKKLPNDWTITGEFLYSKDIQATYMYNANLNESNGFALNNGSDNRQRYLTATTGSNAYYAGKTQADPGLQNAIILANTHKGYSYSATLRIQKQIRNFTGGVSYTFQNTMTAMEGGSTASSLWAARAVSGDPNKATLAHPTWSQPNRVFAYGNYRIEYAKHLATIIGATWEAAPSGVTSYTYSGDINGDGNTSNDLIYIPKNSSDIHLVDAGSGTAGTTTGTAKDPRTASQIWAQLNNFITQDHYLNIHRGQYVKANSIVEPMYKQMNLHLGEDIYFFSGSGSSRTKHTLSLTMDMLNVGNFISKAWGVEKFAATSTPLKFEGMSADGKTPYISMPFSDATNLVPYTSSFTPSTTLASRWQAQFGIRYMFN